VAGLGPGTHVFVAGIRDFFKTWMPGTSPGTALFIAAGYAPAARWRRPLRGAAIGFFLVALLVALAEIVLWLADSGP
jgi:hypothetical protein